MNKSIPLSLIFLSFISMPLISLGTVEDADSSPEIPHVNLPIKEEIVTDTESVDIKEEAPKTWKERTRFLGKGLGYASLNAICAGFIVLFTKKLYNEYWHDWLGDAQENSGLEKGSELEKKNLERFKLKGFFNKPARLATTIALNSIIVYTNYKYKMIPQTLKFFRQALK